MTVSAWPPARRQAAIAHSLVNGLGVLALCAMHIWGSLSAEWAGAGVLMLCGLWARVTSGKPPTGPPGASGLLVGLVELVRRA